MPFRDKDEKFPKRFLADSEEDAVKLYKEFEYVMDLLAFKYSKLTGLSKDDLKSEALIGLARANRDFDVKRSERFKIFALFKIKDALNEYVADQALDVSVPQYLINLSSIMARIYKILASFDVETDGSYLDIWKRANMFIKDTDIKIFADKEGALEQAIKDVMDFVEKVENMAKRSCATISELLQRAETIPSVNKPDMFVNIEDEEHSFNSGEFFIDTLTTTLMMKKIKSILSEEDYNLIVDHYIKGKTVRELETTMGIKGSSITVKIHKITETLKKILKAKYGEYGDH